MKTRSITPAFNIEADNATFVSPLLFGFFDESWIVEHLSRIGSVRFWKVTGFGEIPSRTRSSC